MFTFLAACGVETFVRPPTILVLSNSIEWEGAWSMSRHKVVGAEKYEYTKTF